MAPPFRHILARNGAGSPAESRHATLLHLIGLDHKTLPFKRPGGDGSLGDGPPARVVNELLS